MLLDNQNINQEVSTGFIQTWQIKIPWHFPDFSDTNLNFLDITVLAEKLGFIQTFVYSYSLQHFFQFWAIILNFAKFLFKLFSICI